MTRSARSFLCSALLNGSRCLPVSGCFPAVALLDALASSAALRACIIIPISRAPTCNCPVAVVAFTSPIISVSTCCIRSATLAASATKPSPVLASLFDMRCRLA